MKRQRRNIIIVVLALMVLLAGALLYHNPDWRIRRLQAQTTRLLIEMDIRDEGHYLQRQIEITDRAEINQVLNLISTRPWLGFRPRPACACCGNPRFHLFKGTQPLAMIMIFHGDAIRCQQVSPGNLPVRKDRIPLLKQYFAKLGITEYQDEVPVR